MCLRPFVFVVTACLSPSVCVYLIVFRSLAWCEALLDSTEEERDKLAAEASRLAAQLQQLQSKTAESLSTKPSAPATTAPAIKSPAQSSVTGAAVELLTSDKARLLTMLQDANARISSLTLELGTAQARSESLAALEGGLNGLDSLLSKLPPLPALGTAGFSDTDADSHGASIEGFRSGGDGGSSSLTGSGGTGEEVAPSAAAGGGGDSSRRPSSEYAATADDVPAALASASAAAKTLKAHAAALAEWATTSSASSSSSADSASGERIAPPASVPPPLVAAVRGLSRSLRQASSLLARVAASSSLALERGRDARGLLHEEVRSLRAQVSLLPLLRRSICSFISSDVRFQHFVFLILAFFLLSLH